MLKADDNAIMDRCNSVSLHVVFCFVLCREGSNRSSGGGDTTVELNHRRKERRREGGRELTSELKRTRVEDEDMRKKK